MLATNHPVGVLLHRRSGPEKARRALPDEVAIDWVGSTSSFANSYARRPSWTFRFSRDRHARLTVGS